VRGGGWVGVLGGGWGGVGWVVLGGFFCGWGVAEGTGGKNIAGL